ncbi:TIGR01777 family oxidoreductase [Virgisporangium aurantiacum]|uniref:TIGR01777 family oxidoreductase n=1 Tax=Virgisporangium aurantiacum TaxID=175570 RepID=UPI00194F63D0|nr:TIGR01777 family oxidoreductase [Virgisporangium aurantiacum]
MTGGGAQHQRKARVVIAGASGLIGQALCASYRYGGHTVCRLVRREAEKPDERSWDPERPDPELVDGCDILVNLAGSPLNGRWTAARKNAIRASRIGTAAALAGMVAGATKPPRVFLSASGIRWYGIDRGDEELTEASEPGPYDGLLPTVAQDWEKAAGDGVVHLRLGLVLSRKGGLLERMLPLFKLGLGGRFGTGREYWSHVSLADAVGAIRFLAMLPGAAGAYNVTAPEPVRNRDFATALGRALRRPAAVSLPYAVLRPVLGEVADEVFGGLRVVPHRLTEAGFGFRHPDVDTAIRAALTDG